jgi:hypothetical protein
MIETFRNSIADSEKLRVLYHHCVDDLRLPGDYCDLLRMAHIYCMSALDKLVHDMIAYYMVETFAGRRPPTSKFLAETISIDNHTCIVNSTMPPAATVFEGVVRCKLAHQSFMDPEKLAKGLGLIWAEEHKWQIIASAMGLDREGATTELRNLYRRRNAIVHETDWDPTTGEKMPFFPGDAERTETFIRSLGEALFSLV